MILIQRLVRSKLLNRGVWMERSTSLEALSSFIADLRPSPITRPMRRFGPSKDGGYLLPDDLEGIASCVSPGVSTECGFDKSIADLGIEVHLADASVSGPSISHEKFRFTKRYFDTFNSSETVTIDDFCRDISPSQDLLLQMDIEGAEYRVLNSASPQLLSRFRVMVIEFHDMGQLFTRFGFREISAVFRKLLDTHAVVHIHPNNYFQPVTRGPIAIPPLMEFTFYRRDRVHLDPRTLAFPHSLDAKNVDEKPDVLLPKCWYDSSVLTG
jgi:hypothetical protein